MGLSGGTIVSYDGSTPGITEGLNTALPAAGNVPGDMYITVDTQQVYRWDGTAWSVILSGGGGGTFVINAGNATSLQVGPRAARPVSGTAVGQMYLADATIGMGSKTLYYWTGLTWVELLSDNQGNILGSVANQRYALGTATPNTIAPGSLFEISNQLIFNVGPVFFRGPNQLGFAVRIIGSGGSNFASGDMLMLINAAGPTFMTISTGDRSTMYPGQLFIFKKTSGAGFVRLEGLDGATIDGGAIFNFGGGTATASITVQYDGANFWVV